MARKQAALGEVGAVKIRMRVDTMV